MESFGAIGRHIGPDRAAVPNSPPNNAGKAQSDWQIKPDESVRPRHPVLVCRGVAALKYPLIPRDNLMDQWDFFGAWPFDPPRFPMDLIHVINGQPHAFAHDPGERAFAGTRPTIDRHALHVRLVAGRIRDEKRQISMPVS